MSSLSVKVCSSYVTGPLARGVLLPDQTGTGLGLMAGLEALGVCNYSEFASSHADFPAVAAVARLPTGQYLVPSGISIADLALFDAVDLHLELFPLSMSRFPELVRLHNRVARCA